MKSKSSTLEHLVMPCFLMHMLSSCYVWVLFPLDCCVAVALFHRDVLPRPGDGLGLCGAFECPAETPRAAHKVPKPVGAVCVARSRGGRSRARDGVPRFQCQQGSLCRSLVRAPPSSRQPDTVDGLDMASI
jgi:hypothetical protein